MNRKIGMGGFRSIFGNYPKVLEATRPMPINNAAQPSMMSPGMKQIIKPIPGVKALAGKRTRGY